MRWSWSMLSMLVLAACGSEAPDEAGDCAPGARRCWETVAQTCTGHGTWENAEACAFGCDAGTCIGTCAEDGLRCDGLQVQRCSAGAWSDEGDACAFGCREGACTGVCDGGETRCWGDVVQRCDEEGAWQNEESCPFTCTDGACTGSCAEESLRCDGLQLQRCSGGAWSDESEACSFGCIDGACTGACEAGATRCWLDVAQTCDADGSWQNRDACPFLCIDGACAGECTPGAERCAGRQVQRCVGGFWQDHGEACSFGCQAASCTGVCTVGERTCEGDVLRRCDLRGAWQTEELCPFVCADERCAGVCVPGTGRCVGDAVELCGSDGTWRATQTCADGCADGACAGTCSEDETRCYGDVLQRCDRFAQWANERVCDAGCGEGHCLECTVGSTRCAGTGVESCVAPGIWNAAVTCPSGQCTDGACVAIPEPSCAPGGPGLTDCGPAGDESCCAHLLVPGGPFLQDNDARYPAEVAPFRLDRFEITVGRFRQFVAAMDAGWRPAAGAGRHLHLGGGAGLLERGTTADYEAGWDSTWSLPADWNAAFAAAFACNWTDQPGANENKAMNCIHWQEAYAFCIWDGGFLPSEAEWNFAAAGGGDASGQRIYPWGSAEPDTGDYAIHMGTCPGGGWCNAPDLVGTMPAGAGRWGHLDLAGNAAEWVLDWYETPYPAGSPCVDCVNLTGSATMRGLRGGAHWDPPGLLATDLRYYGTPDFRVIGAGARCARAP